MGSAFFSVLAGVARGYRMPTESGGFDVKQLVDQSGQKLSVDELKSKGFERINVLDKHTFNQLIQEAVERIISTRTNLLTDKERQHIFAQSQNELKMLMQEHSQLKTQAQLEEKGKQDLIRDIENLQKQVHLQRQVSAQTEKIKYEEGMDSQKPFMDELKREVESLEKENSKLEAKLKDAERELKEAERELNAAPKADQMSAMMEQMSAKLESSIGTKFQSRIDQLEAENNTLKTKAHEEVEAKGNNQMAALMEKMNAKMEAIESQQKAMFEQEEIRNRLEAEAKKDERVGQNIESLMMKMQDSMAKRMKSIISGQDNDVEYRPGAATLDEMFKQELESNLENIDTKSSETKEAGSTLDKLKALKKKG